ncbi:MAG: flagellar assembly protein FliH [Candidimonas sp.]|nr:MAG: flagellar assembly protein FliH [Candidimonas sp.]TAM27106.1 MAG: flagellar assembly protein FliH [Candidimonas sp.]
MSDKWLPSTTWPPTDSWARWKMASFERPAQETPLPVQLAEEQEQARLAARKKAQAEGYAQGHAQGLAEGTRTGLKTGHEQGYQAGFSEGHAAGRASSLNETEQLQSLLAACAKALESIEAEIGQSLISLAMQIAQRVVHGALAIEPEKILDTIRDIFRLDADHPAPSRLMVNPADLELIKAQLADDPNLNKWQILPDPSIERGGCIAETALGDIDATLQTRWRRVTAALGRDHPWIAAT